MFFCPVFVTIFPCHALIATLKEIGKPGTKHISSCESGTTMVLSENDVLGEQATDGHGCWKLGNNDDGHHLAAPNRNNQVPNTKHKTCYF